ncbi:CsxC family protein [Proteiniborus sp.]|uniref:CsxC family protein n=1 Tax=Proteiniborus sp. TaxID=2079015 RepID=UPI00331A19CE
MSYQDNNQYGSKVNYGKQETNSVCKPGKSVCTDVTSTTLVDAENYPVDLAPIVSGVVAKIPVVLAELTVQVNVDSIIELPEPAIEIKNIKKHLKITQCLLLQDTNMLFVKGFVRKNIEFATLGCSNAKGICGDIKHCTIDVPFKFTTPVKFNGIAPARIRNRSESEFQYFRQRDLFGPEFADKDKLLSGDLSEFNQTTTEFFNELPFCELISSRIVEFDEFLNPTKPHKVTVPFEERIFKNIEEKMVIFITLKILQKRQVAIGATGGTTCPSNYE